MDYLTEIKPLEEAGMPDATIAVFGSALTKNPVVVNAVRSVLYAAEQVEEFDQSGPLIDAVNAIKANAETADQIKATKLARWFIQHTLFSGSDRILPLDGKSTPGDFIAPVEVVLGMQSLLPAVIPDTTIRGVVWAGIVAVGGGLKYPDGPNAADIATIRQSYADETANVLRRESIDAVRANIENTWVNPAMADGTTTAAELIASIKAGL